MASTANEGTEAVELILRDRQDISASPTSSQALLPPERLTSTAPLIEHERELRIPVVPDLISAHSQPIKEGELRNPRTSVVEDWELQKPPDGLRKRTQDILDSAVFKYFVLVLTLYALFADDFRQLFTHKEADLGFSITAIVIGVIFLLEAVMLVITNHYWWRSLFFWLDVLACLSMVFDVVWVSEALFIGGGTGPMLGRIAQEYGRGARLAKVPKIVRLVKLFRIIGQARIQKTLKEAQEAMERDYLAQQKFQEAMRSPTGGSGKIHRRRLKREAPSRNVLNLASSGPRLVRHQNSDAKADSTPAHRKHAGAMEYHLSEMVTNKVITLILAVLLVLPLLETWHPLSPGTDAMAIALNSLEQSFVDVQGLQESQATKDQLRKSFANSFLKAYPATLQLTVDSESIVKVDYDYLRASESVEASSLSGKSFVVVSESNARRNDAFIGILTTLFFTLLLGIGFISWAHDMKRMSRQVAAPLKELREGMANLARLELTQEPQVKSQSKMYELVSTQQSFAKLRRAVEAFSRYAPREVVRQLFFEEEDLERPDTLGTTLGVSPRVVTIFFSDIAGFTTICEQMQPGDMLELLSEYFKEMAEIITANGGVLLEFIGDAVMALWNAPNMCANQSASCVEAAVRMHERLDELRPLWVSRGLPEVRIRVGIHTANVFVGNIGAPDRMKYGVIGDGVNLASRLEELNKRYGTRMLVSNDTLKHDKVRQHFISRPVDVVVVKGRSQYTLVHEVMARKLEHRTPETDFLFKISQLHKQAFDCYMNRKFVECLSLLDQEDELVRGLRELHAEKKGDEIHLDSPASLSPREAQGPGLTLRVDEPPFKLGHLPEDMLLSPQARKEDWNCGDEVVAFLRKRATYYVEHPPGADWSPVEVLTDKHF